MVVHTQGWNAEMADGWLLSAAALIVTSKSGLGQASAEDRIQLS